MSERFVDLGGGGVGARGAEPVVALETTLVTHGLPQPEGARVAAQCEDEVAARGAVPATIGVLEGACASGSAVPSSSSSRRFPGAPSSTSATSRRRSRAEARARPRSPRPCSRRRASASRCSRPAASAASTAARGGDVSADLTALARYPVAVVCAGAKAVLDLARTVEMLETLGVPVFGFRTDEFPAFYRRSSGLPVDRRFDDIADLAAAVRAHFELGLGTGVVVANPIPAEHEMPRELYERALSAALAATDEPRARPRRDAVPARAPCAS